MPLFHYAAINFSNIMQDKIVPNDQCIEIRSVLDYVRAQPGHDSTMRARGMPQGVTELQLLQGPLSDSMAHVGKCSCFANSWGLLYHLSTLFSLILRWAKLDLINPGLYPQIPVICL